MNPTPQKLTLYLDSIKDKDPGNISDQEIIKFIETATESIETFCYMVDYVDRWERASNEFKVATIMHLGGHHKNEIGDLLGVKYMDYYRRATDPKDVASKIINDLVNTTEDRYGSKVH
jgi:hypothetical protein